MEEDKAEERANMMGDPRGTGLKGDEAGGGLVRRRRGRVQGGGGPN